MGHRRTTRDLTIFDQKVSRVYNGKFKNKERVRRHNRLIAALKDGQTTPTVLSWLSQALEVPPGQITKEDIDAFIKAG